MAGHGLRLGGIVLACTLGASAQTLLDAAQEAAARTAFDSAASDARLRCGFQPHLPALTYLLQFQTGFLVDIPLKQLGARDQTLKVYLRVTPDGRPPVYLASTAAIRHVPDFKGDVQLITRFAVGEGAYSVEALVQDEDPRSCYKSWRIQTPPGLLGDLKPVTPAGSVQVAGSLSDAGMAPGAPAIDRLTILVHADSFKASSAGMEPALVKRVADSIESLLGQLPARSVRLALFNLEKNLVLLTRDPFRPPDLADVIHACEQLQVFAVSVAQLSRRDKPDVLTHLLQKEMDNPQPASAVVLIGPRTPTFSDMSFSGEATSHLRWFYLEIQPPPIFQRPLRSIPDVEKGRVPVADTNTTGRPLIVPLRPDGIEPLVRQMNGTIFPIASPRDLVAALHLMKAAIPVSPAPQAEFDGEARLMEMEAGPPEGGSELRPLSGKEDPVEVLAKLESRLDVEADRIPDHTCVETVQRDRYTLHSDDPVRSCATILGARKLPDHRLSLTTTDWLRLQVGISVAGEVYSWAAGGPFTGDGVDQLVLDGDFGTGPFAAILLAILDDRDPRYRFDGETVLDGRRVLRYSFHVPREESQYRVRAGAGWVATGYTGTLHVDPQTSNLVRFRVITDDLPLATQGCAIETTLDYHEVRLGESPFLLPAVARQRFIDTTGNEAENRVTFGSCQEFSARSSISFAAQPPVSPSPASDLPVRFLPPGLTLSAELSSDVILGKAAAGDAVKGRLWQPLLEANTGKVIAPAGSTLLGRLTKVERRGEGRSSYTVALRWEVLYVGTVPVPLHLRPKGEARSEDVVDHPAGQTGDPVGGLRSQWITTAAH